jgi:hypothetical protein
MLHVFLTFIIFPLHKLAFTEQAQVTLQVRLSFAFYYLSIAQINRYKTNPSYSASASQCFRFGVKIFSLSAPCWDPKKIFSSRTETRFWRPCRRGMFETSMVVTVIITKLLNSAFITNIWLQFFCSTR